MIDVTIVITNYNKGHLLERAVRSAVNQLLVRKSIEVILVDDASSDDSLSRLVDLHSQIRIIRHDTNLGVAGASNSGLEAALGKYWMRLDADDYLSQMTVQHMATILDANEDFGFVYSDHLRIQSGSKEPELVRLDTRRNLMLHGAGVLFRTDLLREIGGYDISLRNGEDTDLLGRLLNNDVTGFYYPVPFYRYFVQDGGLTNEAGRDRIIQKLGEKYEF